MRLLNANEVMIRSLEDACGLTAYKITLTLRDLNVATDVEYQKNYTSYYRVRRDEAWLIKYYSFMETYKNDNTLNFETILRYLSNIPHKVKVSRVNPSGYATTVEASFASKMLATINPDFPIWDSQVVAALGYDVVPTLRGEDKIRAYVEAYANLKKEVDDFIHTSDGVACLSLFDAQFPRYAYINPVKKIDYFLWNIGKP